MKRIIALAAAGLLSTAALPALAQQDPLTQNPAGAETGSDMGNFGAEMGSEAGADAGADTDLGSDLSADPGIDLGTTAATGDANFGSVISSIRSGKMDTDFSSVTDESNVNVVRVDSLTGASDDPQALENAISQNQEEIDSLRSAIEGNDTIASKLEAESVSASDVVATEVGADGTLTVYVQ